MGQTIEITVFAFDELDEDAKATARDWYRQGALHDDWWDAIFDDFEAACGCLGVTVNTRRDGSQSRPRPSIYFSGFSSQGDGACFEATYRYRKAARRAIRAYAPQDVELHRIADELSAIQRRNFYQLRAEIRHRGRYAHEYCMTVDVRRLDAEMTVDAKDIVAEALRDIARWLYRQLEIEHDYLMSDEAVDESLAANDYRFTESGQIFA